MRRVSNILAVVTIVLSLSASNAFAARTVDQPRRERNPIIRIVKGMIRALGDWMSEPKP